MSTGYRVVPVEPTTEMIYAASQAKYPIMRNEVEAFSICYRAMLGAAPERPAEKSSTCAKSQTEPAPPAGGEPEDLLSGLISVRRNAVRDDALNGGREYYEKAGIAEDDVRARITRLQAEVERVRDAIQAEWRKSDGAWIRERDSLKAEVERHKLQSHCHLQRAKLAESELRVTKQALESLKGERNDLQSNLAKAQGLLSEASGKMYIDTQLKLRIAEFQRQSAPAAKPESWPCWSCKTHVTMANRADADGNCPHCEAELDLEDWPSSAAKDGE